MTLKNDKEIKKIELPPKEKFVFYIVFALFMTIATYIVSKETWGIYVVLIPTTITLHFLDDCNITWDVNKKYTVIKYISLILMAFLLTQLGLREFG